VRALLTRVCRPQLRDTTTREAATAAAPVRDLDHPPPDAAQIPTGMPTALSATSDEGAAQVAITDATAIARSVPLRAVAAAARTLPLRGVAQVDQVESATEVTG
jgi:hypothetical protein